MLLDKIFCGFELGDGKKCEKWIKRKRPPQTDLR